MFTIVDIIRLCIRPQYRLIVELIDTFFCVSLVLSLRMYINVALIFTYFPQCHAECHAQSLYKSRCLRQRLLRPAIIAGITYFDSLDVKGGLSTIKYCRVLTLRYKEYKIN